MTSMTLKPVSKPKRLVRGDARSAITVLDRLCVDLAALVSELTDPKLSEGYRSELRGLYAVIEAQALKLASRLPIDKVNQRAIANSGSLELIRLVPVTASLEVAPWGSNLQDLMDVAGVSFVEELEKRYAFGAATMGHIVVASESRPEWLPMLERHVFSPFMKSEFVGLWAQNFCRTGGLSRIFAVAPNIAPRLLKRQCQAWPENAKKLHRLIDTKTDHKDAATFAGVYLTLGESINEIDYTTRTPGSAHEKMAFLNTATAFMVAADAAWACERTAA